MLNIKPFCKFVIHQDLQPSRIKEDLKDVQSVIYPFKSSFITLAEESSLKTLSSGIVSTETLRKVLEKNYKKKNCHWLRFGERDQVHLRHQETVLRSLY